MAPSKKYDILWNVVFPILAGMLCYWVLSGAGSSFSLVRNYLPDGLWAYAFCSLVFIIWDRKIHLVWLLLIILVFFLFEMLQSNDTIAGTADTYDVLVYLVFGIIAVLLNKFFVILFPYKPKST